MQYQRTSDDGTLSYMLSVESYAPVAHVDFPAPPKSKIACHFLVHVSVNAVVGAQ